MIAPTTEPNSWITRIWSHSCVKVRRLPVLCSNGTIEINHLSSSLPSTILFEQPPAASRWKNSSLAQAALPSWIAPEYAFPRSAPRSYTREYLTCCAVRITRWSAGQSPPPRCGLGAHHRRWTAIIVPLLPGVASPHDGRMPIRSADRKLPIQETVRR